jgi:S1-C subfamily serine protease
VALAAQPFNPENVNPPGLTGVLKGGEVGAGEVEALGMGVEELVPELALAFGIPEGEKGVVITESGAGQAQVAGLLPGDVIKAINNRPVRTIVDYIKAMRTADLKRGISLTVSRQGRRFDLIMKG